MIKTMNQDVTSEGKTRIFLVDDHPIVRMGLAQLINQESGFVVCGEAENSKKALIGIAEQIPDIVIVDISLGDGDGIELIKSTRLNHPEIKFLVLSIHDEDVYAERALSAGAGGYIMKHEAAETVIAAIRKVMGGDIYLSERMSGRLLSKIFHGTMPPCGLSLDHLSTREMEVFQLIGDGWSTKQIAERLGLSVKTVETYREKIKIKLALKDSSELLRQAIRWQRDERSKTK
jgi:DNA-binding NarL/FixJ family response regulator